MRNLRQYPITIHEIVECLEKLADEINPPGPNMAIGDMRPLLLNFIQYPGHWRPS